MKQAKFTPPVKILINTVILSIFLLGCSQRITEEIWNKIYAETFTVIFHPNGGSYTLPQKIKDGNKAELPDAPHKNGWIFGSWYEDNETFLNEWDFNSPIRSNITLYAKWDAYSYTVTFDTGEPSEISPITVESPKTTVENLPATPKKDGEIFGGWWTEIEGGGTRFTENTIVNGDITVYAYWSTIPIYSVSYDANGAESGDVPVDETQYYSGNEVVVQGNTGILKIEGKFFSGWNTEADGTGNNYIEGSAFNIGTSDVVLYAKWTETPTFYVVYNGNNATSGDVPIDEKSYTTGSTVTVLGNTGNLARTNYTFVSWNTKADGTGTNYNADSTFNIGSSNVILYAKWISIATYTVTYNANEATSGTVPVDSTQYTQGQDFTVLENSGELVRDDYRFTGWNGRSDGTGADFTIGTNYPIETANVILYAKWAQVYSVTYNGNDETSGTVPVDSNKYTQGEDFTVAGNSGSLTKEGLVFAGWNTKTDGTGITYQVGLSSQMGGSNLTLYAKWSDKQQYSVIFNCYEGTLVAAQLIEQGEKAKKPADPTNTGYLFGGWYKESGYVNLWDFDIDTVTTNTTLHAKWNTYNYTVTFNSEGATTFATESVESPQTTVSSLPSINPTKTGYTFDSWRIGEGGTGVEFTTATVVTGDITVYAKWTPKNYDVTFNANGGSGSMSNLSITFDQSANLTVNAFTRTGYSFAGWNTESNGSGTSYADQASFSMTVEGQTLYAKWTPNNYTVTFNANGGSGTMSNQSITFGQSANLTVNAFTRTGFSFAGWNTESNGSGTSYANQAPFNMTVEGQTLYAIWQDNLSVTIMLNNPAGINVDFDENEATLSKSGRGSLPKTMTVTATTGFNAYAWYLNEESQASEINTITIDSDGLYLGVHNLWLVVTDSNGTVLSAQFDFWVEE